MFRKPFFNGKPVADPVAVLLDAINGVDLQHFGNLQNFLLIYPDVTGFTATAVSGTLGAGAWVKTEIKPGRCYDGHLLRLLPGLFLFRHQVILELFQQGLG